MSVAKITISLDDQLLARLDSLVRTRRFASRSQAIQEAVQEKVERLARTRLAQECAKLDIGEERALADLGLAAEAETWPPY